MPALLFRYFFGPSLVRLLHHVSEIRFSLHKIIFWFLITQFLGSIVPQKVSALFSFGSPLLPNKTKHGSIILLTKFYSIFNHLGKWLICRSHTIDNRDKMYALFKQKPSRIIILLVLLNSVLARSVVFSILSCVSRHKWWRQVVMDLMFKNKAYANGLCINFKLEKLSETLGVFWNCFFIYFCFVLFFAIFLRL